jgi:hypothetical protein
MRVLELGHYALCISIAAAMLAACGGSQPPGIGVSAIAGSGHASSPVRMTSRSFHRYYLAKFTDVVGYSLPFSTLCLRFKSSGVWFSVTSAFTGTYLTSGNQLFASALAPWSPTAYASLQGSVSAERGSGDYVITQPTGAIYSGGTFTMTRARGSGCR